MQAVDEWRKAISSVSWAGKPPPIALFAHKSDLKKPLISAADMDKVGSVLLDMIKTASLIEISCCSSLLFSSISFFSQYIVNGGYAFWRFTSAQSGKSVDEAMGELVNILLANWIQSEIQKQHLLQQKLEAKQASMVSHTTKSFVCVLCGE